MDAISNILELYYKLNSQEQLELMVKLNNISYGDEIKPTHPSNCPHCNSARFTGYGNVNGRKRYMCKDCKRTFGDYSDTTFNNIKKMDKFLLFKNILFTEGIFPLKTLCKRVGISIQTSFDWRHKLMASLKDSESKFITETQLDDLWLSYSQKGRKGLKYSKERGGNKKSGDNNYQVKVLTATDKSQTVMNVVRIGRITKSDIQVAVGDRMGQDVKLVSDSHASIIGFAKDNNIKHVCFKAKDHVAQTGENVQHLNGQASRFKTMVNRNLKGVSTKYLQNYANYFSFMETNKTKDVNKMATLTIVEDKEGWDKFTNIEARYKKFIEDCSVRTYRCPTARSWKANNWNAENLAS